MMFENDWKKRCIETKLNKCYEFKGIDRETNYYYYDFQFITYLHCCLTLVWFPRKYDLKWTTTTTTTTITTGTTTETTKLRKQLGQLRTSGLRRVGVVVVVIIVVVVIVTVVVEE